MNQGNANDPKPTTQTLHGRLWGMRARDWAEVQEGQVAPAYHAVLDRLGASLSGADLLDAGCGSGMFAGLAAARGARVAGIDAADPLLAIARERTPDGDFQSGDLEALPFADQRFQVVTGFNAFQFAGNPQTALAEARRVMVPGGQLFVVTWGEPDGMPAAAAITALRGLLPAPPPGTPGPFALSDRAALSGFASAAGFQVQDVFDVSAAFAYRDRETALRGLNSSGVAARAIEAAGEPAVSNAHAAAIAPFTRPDGSVVMDARFRVLLATKP